MEKRLTDKVAIVTGASRGIGRAISVSLAKEGATVILTARNREKLNETANLITQAGGKCEIISAELTNEESIKDLVKTTEQKFSRLDILVNNAGVTHSAKLEDTDTKAWNKCLDINARGPFILIREALGLLKKAEGLAYIVNISSVVGVKGYPLQSAYTASKHALRGMTISLAEELRGTNVQVRLICPGGVKTEMVTKVRPDIKTDELIDPAEIAELVVYLVTHKGNGVIDEIHIRRQTSTPWF
ncbi:MAG: SDR family NAD(P)-dependent oxidoreductase [Planctomycetota bacterium]|jgi:NAD(P)-dependent dehydrogenase (short-subunit alcohol dehydrogenase family)